MFSGHPSFACTDFFHPLVSLAWSHALEATPELCSVWLLLINFPHPSPAKKVKKQRSNGEHTHSLLYSFQPPAFQVHSSPTSLPPPCIVSYASSPEAPLKKFLENCRVEDKCVCMELPTAGESPCGGAQGRTRFHRVRPAGWAQPF